MEPIFIGWTRSFWATVGTVALIVSDSAILDPLIDAADSLWPGAGGVIATWAPVVTAVWAIYERSGAARPYTLDPRALK